MRSPISSPFTLRRRLISANGWEACSRSAIIIMAKNSWSVVCEMSTMLAWASASTADTAAMMPTRSWPMTVTMMRLLLDGMCRHRTAGGPEGPPLRTRQSDSTYSSVRRGRGPGIDREHPGGADEDDDTPLVEHLGFTIQLRQPESALRLERDGKIQMARQ